jgi:hypothetical protein
VLIHHPHRAYPVRPDGSSARTSESMYPPN